MGGLFSKSRSAQPQTQPIVRPPPSDHILVKAFLTGECGVGKTAIVEYIRCGMFTRHMGSIQADFTIRTMQLGRFHTKLQLWDVFTGYGTIRRPMRNAHRSTNIMIFCYDMTSLASFDALKAHVTQFVDDLSSSPEISLRDRVIVVCGCQADRLGTTAGQQRVVSLDKVREFIVWLYQTALQQDEESAAIAAQSVPMLLWDSSSSEPTAASVVRSGSAEVFEQPGAALVDWKALYKLQRRTAQVLYAETSALSGLNVEEMVQQALRTYVDRAMSADPVSHQTFWRCSERDCTVSRGDPVLLQAYEMYFNALSQCK
eukprot:TRINITY_DN2576_c0_g2_i8.p1 TRINITY_DN2576_c0_g2~~TRINITY_DN2576_c0_g2_i8.p1  ORF type:complete len:315 (+),score=53.69 TRINITY_DN2576_c0_g2_i8:258-1202(+)